MGWIERECHGCEGRGYLVDEEDCFNPRSMYGHYTKSVRYECEDCTDGIEFVCDVCGCVLAAKEQDETCLNCLELEEMVKVEGSEDSSATGASE